ncbi:hypothetical protein LIER_30364 [Lithospermum erythrorhizon]|uniref:Reverse transcriptase n=1 Tax=Lithospermum erythrorhizon TaxID=34254 RepID=A0AAV3RT84_LITER
MCTDFTSLNKAYPKDFYPLPCLGRLVDGSTGHEVFYFMDASRGYHQIRMLLEDEEKTTFFMDYTCFVGREKHEDLCRRHVGEEQGKGPTFVKSKGDVLAIVLL